MLDNLAAQMRRQGLEFGKADISTRQAMRHLERVAVSLVQQADALVETVAKLEAEPVV